MNLIITLLGTGTSQGVPVVACDCEVCKSKDSRDKRLRTSVLIESSQYTIVIDAGPDFRQQMLREKVKKLDAILITHDHKDHIGGLDDIRAFNWVHQKPMEIFGLERSLSTIRKDFAYAFEEIKYPGVPEIKLHSIETLPFDLKGITIIPIAAVHGTLPVLGYRIGDFSYLTDASSIAPEELDKMKGSKVVVINALRKRKHHSHFNLEEALEILQSLKPEKGYLTHISHQLGFHADISNHLPAGVELAYDGMKLVMEY